MTEYVNWFQNDGQKNFYMHLLRNFAGKPIRSLQIGAYTGDASVWLYENLLTHPESVLIDVDTWEGSDEPVHHQMDWSTVENLYDFKTKQGQEERKIVKYKGTSDSFFKNNREMYDFIYVDGSHLLLDCYLDLVLSWKILNIGGILAIDDYLYKSDEQNILNSPHESINHFLKMIKNEYILLNKGYLVFIQKI